MFVTHLECSRCGAKFESEQLINLCRCGAPLLVRYDLEQVKARLSRDDLACRAPDLWRYRELLPVRESENIVSLGEGMTPLVRLDRLGAELGLSNLYMKDEGLLPTGSFKARGAAVGVSRAKELGVKAVAMPTIGIGAGKHCDGQVLVTHDMVGMFEKFIPSFVKQYVNLAPQIKEAVGAYRQDVKNGSFPAEEHSFAMQLDIQSMLDD